LEKAFLKTYGENINDVFGDLDLAIATFRWSVKSLLPALTRVGWTIKKPEIVKDNPTYTSRKFHYKMKRKEYYKEFGRAREKPKFGDRVLAIIIEILPKIGPLKPLKFKDPGPEGEKLFIKSFDTAMTRYGLVLQAFQNKTPDLTNVDYDTGKLTTPGEYGLADKTYSEMVIKLDDKKFANLTLALKENILSFYSKVDTSAKFNEHKKDKADWQKTYLSLQQLKTAKTIPVDSLKLSAVTQKNNVADGRNN
jgi:hypothetical protein